MCVRARVCVFAYLRARVPTFLCAYACLCVCVMECLASLRVRNAYTMRVYSIHAYEYTGVSHMLLVCIYIRRTP